MQEYIRVDPSVMAAVLDHFQGMRDRARGWLYGARKQHGFHITNFIPDTDKIPSPYEPKKSLDEYKKRMEDVLEAFARLLECAAPPLDQQPVELIGFDVSVPVVPLEQVGKKDVHDVQSGVEEDEMHEVPVPRALDVVLGKAKHPVDAVTEGVARDQAARLQCGNKHHFLGCDLFYYRLRGEIVSRAGVW